MDALTTTAELTRTLTVFILPLLFAITVHEAAHAYAAKFFGDTTAYGQGRMSLNPMRHIDPFGTVLLPIMSFYLTDGMFPFGYAKPVPVDFGRLRNPKRDMAWVALAGPAANFVMALSWAILSLVFQATGVNEEFFVKLTWAGWSVNLIILAVNLFPIPPLDGGRIVTSMLPLKYAFRFARIEPYGLVIIIVLMMFQVLHKWVEPVANAAGAVAQMMASPIKYLLL